MDGWAMLVMFLIMVVWPVAIVAIWTGKFPPET